MKTVLSNISEQDLKKLYEEGGMNTAFFAQSIGVTRAKAEKFLKAKGWYQSQCDRHVVRHPDVLAAYLETRTLTDTAKKTDLTPAIVSSILNKILPDWKEINARPQSDASPYSKEEMIDALISTAFRPHKTVEKIGKSYRRWCKQLSIDLVEEQEIFNSIVNQPNLELLIGTPDERYLVGLDGYEELKSFKVLTDNVDLFATKSLNDIADELKLPIIHVKNFRITKNIPISDASYRSSKPELELLEFIRELKPEATKQVFIINGIRREVDIFIPSLNLGIEFNGSYYHSDAILPDDYHKEKKELLRKVNIRLMNIFEHQWESKRDIVKSKIRHALGITSRKIDARKCQVRELNNKEYRRFCEENHIQGYVTASIKDGLFLGDELVAVISFGKPRFGKNHDFELLRACTKIDTVVRGGVTKLSKHATNKMSNGTKIISFNNDMIGTGLIYTTLGFTYLGDSPPSYFYANGNDFVSRYQAQKHNLKSTKGYREELSEREIMKANGYFRIYDCGVSRYEYVVMGKQNE